MKTLDPRDTTPFPARWFRHVKSMATCEKITHFESRKGFTLITIHYRGWWRRKLELSIPREQQDIGYSRSQRAADLIVKFQASLPLKLS